MDIKEFLYQDFSKLKPDNLESFKRSWAEDLGKMPKHSDVYVAYRKLLEEGKIEPNIELEREMTTSKVRSQSGVAPMAVMTKAFVCPGECIYCPLEAGLPKSYLPDEPAAQRALKYDFDPYKQVESRLEQLEKTGHKTDKVELIVIGGTFGAYADDYKIEFFKGIYEALNGKRAESLEEAKKVNQTADRRAVGISVETRPDWVSDEEVRLYRRLGVTKIQLGVQAFDEKIQKIIKRGHGIEAVAQATRKLKNAGFKVSYHFMPNLPGSNPKKDVKMAKQMFEDKRFKPDYLKVYPTQVIAGTVLHRMHQQGEFEAYDDQTLKEVLKKIKAVTPEWVRIDRLVRDISKKWVKSGTHKSNMRQIIKDELKEESGVGCRCIRCREIKLREYTDRPKMSILRLETSGGEELFMSFEKDDKLYSILRLRLPNADKKMLFDELEGAAIVREIHTYGTVLGLSERVKKRVQHRGLGQELLEEAEKQAKKAGYKRVAVISAIGTHQYYEKWGYRLEGEYMVKDL